MRKSYIDNVRWITVVVVVFYHVIYMYATESVTTGLGRITQLETQYYDILMYFVYPWIMTVLFLVAGMCSRYYLERHTDREFLRSRTTRLLVPSTRRPVVHPGAVGTVGPPDTDPKDRERPSVGTRRPCRGPGAHIAGDPRLAHGADTQYADNRRLQIRTLWSGISDRILRHVA